MFFGLPVPILAFWGSWLHSFAMLLLFRDLWHQPASASNRTSTHCHSATAKHCFTCSVVFLCFAKHSLFSMALHVRWDQLLNQLLNLNLSNSQIIEETNWWSNEFSKLLVKQSMLFRLDLNEAQIECGGRGGQQLRFPSPSFADVVCEVAAEEKYWTHCEVPVICLTV